MSKPMFDEDGEVRELTRADFERSVRGRPAMPPEERKVRVTTFLDPAVVAYFKQEGRGWQTRLNQALREFIAHQR